MLVFAFGGADSTIRYAPSGPYGLDGEARPAFGGDGDRARRRGRAAPSPPDAVPTAGSARPSFPPRGGRSGRDPPGATFSPASGQRVGRHDQRRPGQEGAAVRADSRTGVGADRVFGQERVEAAVAAEGVAAAEAAELPVDQTSSLETHEAPRGADHPHRPRRPAFGVGHPHRQRREARRFGLGRVPFRGSRAARRRPAGAFPARAAALPRRRRREPRRRRSPEP